MLTTPEVVIVSPLAVKIATAAAMLEVSVPMVYTWLRDGRLKYVRMGHDRRITITELERFLREDRGGVAVKKPKRKVTA